MDRWRHLMQNRLLDAGVFFIALLFVVKIAAVLPSRVYQDDFAYFYLPSKMVLQGENPYTTPLGTFGKQYGFPSSERVPTGSNPPPLLWLFAPVALLEARTGFWVWVAVQAASLCLVLWLTRRLLCIQMSARAWRLFCAGVLCAQPLFYHFAYSQVQLVVALIVLTAFAWHRVGRHTAACLAITAAGFLKLFPFALLPWFVWRSRGGIRQKTGRVIVIAVAMAVAVWLTGFRLWSDFVTQATKIIAAADIDHTFNCSLPSFVANLGRLVFSFSVSSATGHVWYMAGMISGLVLLGAGYLMCLGRVRSQMAEFCLLNAIVLTGGVVCWGHYLVMLIFPTAVAVAWVVKHPSVRRCVWLCLTLLLLDSVDLVANPVFSPYPCLRFLMNYVPLGGLCMLIIFFVKESSHADWPAFFAERSESLTNRFR